MSVRLASAGGLLRRSGPGKRQHDADPCASLHQVVRAGIWQLNCVRIMLVVALHCLWRNDAARTHTAQYKIPS
jgi:hypothetical protein